MSERLTKRFDYENPDGIKYLPNGQETVFPILNKLGELEDLEEQGLLLKLPFKIGDTLYYIDDYEIYHDKVYSIEVTEVNGEHTFCVGCMDWIYDDFGKTVFLTKEEAEEALRKKVE